MCDKFVKMNVVKFDVGSELLSSPEPRSCQNCHEKALIGRVVFVIVVVSERTTASHMKNDRTEID